MSESKAFAPDWISPPGDTISDLLEENEWQQSDLADRTGYTRKHVNDLIKARVAISPDAAERLSKVFGTTVEFWLAREAQYRAAVQRRESLEARRAETPWLKEIPVSWMVKQKLVRKASSKPEQVEECLGFFGVASLDAWRNTCTSPLAAFRASTNAAAREGAVAAWLCAAEREAAAIACKPFDAEGFRDSLEALRALTTERDPTTFVPRLQAICAAHGVAVVFVPAPPKCPVHGATRWLTPTKALLALTLRYKSNDQLWFSFFHEVAHLLKHGKKLLFIEGFDGLDADLEDEANRFAAEVLIPPEHAKQLRQLRSADEVTATAERLGIAPGILVGRLQHDGIIGYHELNDLKVRYSWTSEEA